MLDEQEVPAVTSKPEMNGHHPKSNGVEKRDDWALIKQEDAYASLNAVSASWPGVS